MEAVSTIIGRFYCKWLYGSEDHNYGVRCGPWRLVSIGVFANPLL